MTRPVLLVEDDRRIALALRIRLEGGGYTVLHASTGVAGVEAAAEHRPAVIVLDIRLPDIDGFEVCSRIRDTPGLEETRVLFLSAHSQPAFRARASRVGGDMFISKTCGTGEVVEAVKTLASAVRDPQACASETDQHSATERAARPDPPLVHKEPSDG